jgi:hypothetical protein
MLGKRTGDFHNVRRVFDRGLPEIRQTVPPRIVLFFHQHVQIAIRRQQADRLTALEALLPAGAMLLAMLADLQIAREVDDLAHQCCDLGGIGFAIDRGADCCGRPGLRRFLTQFPAGALYDPVSTVI